MLTRKLEAEDNLIFRLPYANGSLKIRELKLYYEEFIQFMDGSDEDSYLEIYYELNPVSGVYEFKDCDAEEDIADLMKIEYKVCSLGCNPTSN